MKDAACTLRRWLEDLLARNADCAYLRRYGSPRALEDFRARLPLCRHEDVAPWLERVERNEADALFAGRPVAFERTGGSGGGVKRLPYSAAGLLDFQRNLSPWVERMLRDIRGRVYFATSPAARAPEYIGGIPVGLPDGAYLGEDLGRRLAARSIVSPELLRETDMAAWRKKTVEALRQADDLELISVWSPTFLLRLLEDIPDPARAWPRLKWVSCWMSGASRPHAEALIRRLPQARFEAKGLMSTEAVISVPDARGQAVLAAHGFVEFLSEGMEEPAGVEALDAGAIYETIVTTASGLYRYRTGDRARVLRRTATGWPALEFVGRSLCSDLVGEKLEEAFVSQCLAPLAEEALLVPDVRRPGYVLISARALPPQALAETEQRLAANPQYAYARALGQLAPLRMRVFPQPFARVEEVLLERGASPGVLKAMALRPEAFWLECFGEQGTED
ncbi:MAG: GH3 auxin-responsive promoter family protein [Zoogloeaceae bacterium]|jgi:hypothetical protein|nr:GH3 auxin-responsive promoter family protein [Zoogloeaceae bacterium]